jgi:hypothetical protein
MWWILIVIIIIVLLLIIIGIVIYIYFFRLTPIVGPVKIKCNINKECRSGICTNGFCEEPMPCIFNTDCKYGLCVAGICIGPCLKNEDCPNGTCKDTICKPNLITLCFTDNDCDMNTQKCIRNGCVNK